MPIKPISFQAHDVRLIDDFYFEYPTRGAVLFKGKNEIGKTTLLNCMLAQFSANNTTALAQGNKNGWTEGHYVLPTGEEVIVRQDLSEHVKGSRFTLVDQDGNVKKKIGDISDLFQYNTKTGTIEDFIEKGNTEKGKREQREIFLDILSPEVKSSIIALDVKEVELYNKRTEANNEVIMLDNVVKKANPSLTDHVKSKGLDGIIKEVSEAEKNHLAAYSLLETQRQALKPIQEENEKLTSLSKEFYDKVQLYKEKDTFYTDEIAELEKKLGAKRLEKDQELARIKKETLEAKAKKDEQAEKCSQLTSIDITGLEADEAAKKVELLKLKAKYDDYKASDTAVSNYTKEVHNHKEALAKWTKLDDEIKSIRKQKQEIIFSSDCPLKNVRLVEDGIEINIDDRWLPFSQENVSMSSLIITTAYIILLANKHLKVVLISRGESLSQERMKLLVDIAEKEDAIFLVEKVVDDQNEVLVEIIEP